MKVLTAMQPHYLPWLGYLELIRLSDVFVFLDDIQMPNSRSLINRTKVKVGNRTKWLTVPLDKTTTRGDIKNVRTFDSSWLTDHYSKLQNWYSHFPYFQEAMNQINFRESTQSISNFNISYIEKLSSSLKLPTKLVLGSNLDIMGQSSERLVELCRRFDVDCYLTGHGAYNYLDAELFERQGIKVEYIVYNWSMEGLDDTPDGVYLSIFDHMTRSNECLLGRLRSYTVPWKEFDSSMIGFSGDAS